MVSWPFSTSTCFNSQIRAGFSWVIYRRLSSLDEIVIISRFSAFRFRHHISLQLLRSFMVLFCFVVSVFLQLMSLVHYPCLFLFPLSFFCCSGVFSSGSSCGSVFVIPQFTVAFMALVSAVFLFLFFSSSSSESTRSFCQCVAF